MRTDPADAAGPRRCGQRGPGPGAQTALSGRRGRTALVALNGAGVVVAAVFAARGAARPASVSPGAPVTPAARFWAESSAVRTWALAAPLAATLTRPAARSAPGLLVVAGLVQLGDAVLGVRQRNPAMTAAPAVMGLVHLLSARVLATRVTPPAGSSTG